MDIVLNILKAVRPLAVVDAVQVSPGYFYVSTQQGGRVFFDFMEVGEVEIFRLALYDERSYRLYIPSKCENDMVVDIVNFLSCMSFGSHDSSDFGDGDINYVSKLNSDYSFGDNIKSINGCIVLALLVENLKGVTSRVNDCLDLIGAEGVGYVTWGAVASWAGRCAAYAIWRS